MPLFDVQIGANNLVFVAKSETGFWAEEVKMGKKGLSISSNRAGVITIIFPDSGEEIQLKAKTGEEMFELVRTTILAKGLVFTEKIEKMTRKVL